MIANFSCLKTTQIEKRNSTYVLSKGKRDAWKVYGGGPRVVGVTDW